MNKNLILIIFFLSPACFAGKYLRDLGEVRVYEDHVKINVGITYGTCKDSNGKEWWGWSTDNKAHKDWLSLILMAKASGKKVMFYDMHSSCSGPVSNVIGVEGLFLE